LRRVKSLLRSLALFGLLFALCGLPAHAQSSAFDTYVNAAVRLYESLEYERALEQLDKAKKLSRGVDDDALLLFYEGAMKMDLGQMDQGRAAFKTALLLKPDAVMPLKVSPKVRAEVETIRAQVKKELAPMLARQEAERKKQADEEARRLEEQRRADAAKADAAKAAEAAARAKEEEAARLKAAQELAKKQALEKQAVAVRPPDPVVQPSDARMVELVPHERPPELVVAPVAPGRKVPVVGLVFLGLGAAAGGTGAYFGVTSGQQVARARAATYQDDTRARLAEAQSSATIANVLFVSAAVAGAAALIGFIVSLNSPAEVAP